MLNPIATNKSKRIAELELENKILRQTVQSITNDCLVQENKNRALVIERTFWVEQGRALQNQLQVW